MQLWPMNQSGYAHLAGSVAWLHSPGLLVNAESIDFVEMCVLAQWKYLS